MDKEKETNQSEQVDTNSITFQKLLAKSRWFDLEVKRVNIITEQTRLIALINELDSRNEN